MVRAKTPQQLKKELRSLQEAEQAARQQAKDIRERKKAAESAAIEAYGRWSLQQFTDGSASVLDQIEEAKELTLSVTADAPETAPAVEDNSADGGSWGEAGSSGYADAGSTEDEQMNASRLS